LLLINSGSITPSFKGSFGVHWIIKRSISVYIVVWIYTRLLQKKNAIRIDGI